MRVRISIASAAAVLLVLGAVGVATLARPSVSTFDIQRRDRLPPAARFVTFAYQLLLNRPPDPQGLTTYQQMFDQGGPQAVVAAIATSDEYQRLNGSTGTNPSGDTLATVTARTVAAFDAGFERQATGSDGPGRAVFVLVVVASLLTVAWLSRATRLDDVRHDSRIYVPTRYVTALFAALAVMAWANNNLLLASFGAGRFGYIEWLSQITAAASARGQAAVWTPYPQGVQDVLAILQTLSADSARLFASDVWSEFTLFRFGYQLVFLVVPSILSVAVVASIGRRISTETATLAALGTGFSIAPLYYGVLTSNVTDPLPVLCVLTAIACLVSRRSGLAGLAVGVGTVLKFFPLLLLPVGLLFLDSWRDRSRFVIFALLVIAATFIPPALSNFDVFMSPLRWQTGRPPWESWFAFGNWALSAPHEFRAPYFQDSAVGEAFGWVFWGITPRVSALLSPVPAQAWRWENVVSAIGTLLTLCICAFARSSGLSILSLLRWSMFAFAAFMFWGIGWSPQYELYLLPLILLAVRPPSIALATALILEGLTLLEYPVLLPWAYFYGGSVVWVMWATLLARYVVLAWLCVYVVRHEASPSALWDRLASLRLRRRVLTLSAALAVAASLVALPARAQPAQNAPCGSPRPPVLAAEIITDQDWPIPGGHFFSQSGGFSILDDNDAHFWAEFQRLGGWSALGFPVTRRFNWHGSVSQVAQRAVLQWSPVTGQVEFANVLDLLHEQGLDEALLAQEQIPPPSDVDEAGLAFETIAARRLGWLDERPAIKRKYCDAPGGGDPLLLWGLPTSTVTNMANPGSVYVLRTQRAAFQEWVDGAPWAAPGEVTVVLAGDLAKEFQLVPAEAQQPE